MLLFLIATSTLFLLGYLARLHFRHELDRVGLALDLEANHFVAGWLGHHLALFQHSHHFRRTFPGLKVEPLTRLRFLNLVSHYLELIKIFGVQFEQALVTVKYLPVFLIDLFLVLVSGRLDKTLHLPFN